MLLPFLSVRRPCFPSWPSLGSGCWLQLRVHSLAWFRVILQDLCSESSALGFSFPFKLWIDCLKCLKIAGISLSPADFGGGIGQVAFPCKATEKQLESVQRTVNSLFDTSEESRGSGTVGLRSPKRYYGINVSISWFCSPHGGAMWRLLGTLGVKSWRETSSQNKKQKRVQVSGAGWVKTPGVQTSVPAPISLHSATSALQGGCFFCSASSVLEEVIERLWPLGDPRAGPGQWRPLTAPLSLECAVPALGAISRTQPWERRRGDHLAGIRDWTPSRPL